LGCVQAESVRSIEASQADTLFWIRRFAEVSLLMRISTQITARPFMEGGGTHFLKRPHRRSIQERHGGSV
jgi:hypothetical protein